MYNQASHTYQYCSGTLWKAFAKPGPSPGGAGCSNPTATEGKLIYNSAYKVLQYCDGTNWVASGNSGSVGSSCPPAFRVVAPDGTYDFYEDMVGDGTYLYASRSGTSANRRIRAYTFNGTAFTYIAESATTTGAILDLFWGPDTNGAGSYVYAAASATGVEAWNFNGTTWSARVVGTTASGATGVWSNGSYIFVTMGSAGVQAYTFNGTAFTTVGTAYNTPGTADRVWGDGTYIYVADGTSGIRALTWNGSTWTSVGTAAAYDAYDVWGDGTYIYTAGSYDGFHAYTFNGTTFTLVGSYEFPNVGSPDNVYVKNGYIYVGAGTALDVLKFDGTNFTVVAYLPASGVGPMGTYVDNNYIYFIDGFDGINAYPKCN